MADLSSSIHTWSIPRQLQIKSHYIHVSTSSTHASTNNLLMFALTASLFLVLFALIWHHGLTLNNNSQHELYDHKFVFVVGAHHSGTTLTNLIIAEHESVSALTGTRKPADEGQHVQSVYKTAFQLGGILSYAYHPEAHLTENSKLATTNVSEELYQSWSQYWDTSKPYLLEKSPRHILMTRFLQKLFHQNNTYFIVVLRHPFGAWNFGFDLYPREVTIGCGYSELHQWLRIHDVLANDVQHLKNVRVVQLEHMLSISHDVTQKVVDKIFEFLGLSPNVKVKIDAAHPKDFRPRIRNGGAQHSSGATKRTAREESSNGSSLGNFEFSSRSPKPKRVEVIDRVISHAKKELDSLEKGDNIQTQFLLQHIERLQRARDKILQMPMNKGLHNRSDKPNTNGRNLLEYYGNPNREVNVHTGGVFDWVERWNSVNRRSGRCVRVLRELEPRLKDYGYTLLNLTHYEIPKAFKDYMLLPY